MRVSESNSCFRLGLNSYLVVAVWILLVGCCSCQQEKEHDGSFVESSFSLRDKELGPFEWSYARVELPQWFSSMTMRFISNVDRDSKRVNMLPMDRMPIMCFRQGGPPLPDATGSSLENLPLAPAINGSLESIKSLQSVDWCLPFERNITMKLSNEQMSPGLWYVGFFNGLGPSRTQSKMIRRGRTYTFGADLSVEECSISAMWGPKCDQFISQLSCSQPVKQPRKLWNPFHHSSDDADITKHDNRRKLTFDNKTSIGDGNFMACNQSDVSCLGLGDMKFYSLNVVDPTSELHFAAEKVNPSGTSTLNNSVDHGWTILAHFRHNLMPDKGRFDFSALVSDEPFAFQVPKVGQWFVGVRVVNGTDVNGEIKGSSLDAKLCFSVRWKLQTCPAGMAGPNCSWILQPLQVVYRSSRLYFLPLGLSSKSRTFQLETLTTNSTDIQRSDVSWTYLSLEIPRGASGSNLHVHLKSDSKINYEIYAKFGGLPAVDNWDYHANTKSSGNGSMILMRGNNEETIDFYILYVREGSWVIGIRSNFVDTKQNIQTTVNIELESCPWSCSSHGSCRSSVDETGFSSYSYCDCDRDHGGFDCSDELVSRRGHIWQSICLIASNAAALLPAFSALWQKAFAEWVIFTASGASSALYHACDVGTWCALSFDVLQFMDFWLSFMAVVSTFVFMSSFGETSKRTIHACASIITALLAAAGPTRSMNVVIVLTIGAVGLLLGWFLKLPFRRMTVSLPRCAANVPWRWWSIWSRLTSLLRALRKRFSWVFLLMGFVALTAAGVSWMLQTSESYWIWHSAWHVSIYTSSFFFVSSVRGGQGADSALTRVESACREEVDSSSRACPSERSTPTHLSPQ